MIIHGLERPTSEQRRMPKSDLALTRPRRRIRVPNPQNSHATVSLRNKEVQAELIVIPSSLSAEGLKPLPWQISYDATTTSSKKPIWTISSMIHALPEKLSLSASRETWPAWQVSLSTTWHATCNVGDHKLDRLRMARHTVYKCVYTLYIYIYILYIPETSRDTVV